MELQGRGDEIDRAGHHLTRSDTIRRSLRSIWISSGPSGILPGSLGKNQHARTGATNMVKKFLVGCAPSAWREAPLINVDVQQHSRMVLCTHPTTALGKCRLYIPYVQFPNYVYCCTVIMNFFLSLSPFLPISAEALKGTAETCGMYDLASSSF